MGYRTHGGTGTRLYRIWKSMKCRCLNGNHPSFAYYGSRGISIDEAWANDFSEFRRWAILHGYKDGLELDRIDVNGDYEPGNCRWTTHREQSLNRRDTLYATFNGERKTLASLLSRFGIPPSSYFPHRRKGDGDEWLSSRIGGKVVVEGGKTNQEH